MVQKIYFSPFCSTLILKTGEALDAGLTLLENGIHERKLLFYYSVHEPTFTSFCNDSDLNFRLKDVYTYAIRMWSESDLSEFEQRYGNFTYCQWLGINTRQTMDVANSIIVRNIVGTLSDFVCMYGLPETDPPTKGL